MLAKIPGDLQGAAVGIFEPGSRAGATPGFGLTDVLRDVERIGGSARGLHAVAVRVARYHGHRPVALPETVGFEGFLVIGVLVSLGVVELLGGRGGAQLRLGGGVLRLLLLADVGRDRDRGQHPDDDDRRIIVNLQTCWACVYGRCSAIGREKCTWNGQRIGRMKRMTDGVYANLIAARSAWIAHRKCMRTLRRAAEQAPAAAAFAFESTAEHLHSKALTDIYYFGVVLPQARHIQ